MYLRSDPRKNSVPFTGNVVYYPQSFTYLSVNATSLDKCSNSSLAIAGLASFLTSNDILVKGATPDKELANLTKVKFANCQTHPLNPVIIVQEGKETKIEKQTDNCYVISVANCEILEAIEKFQLRSVIDAKNRSLSDD